MEHFGENERRAAYFERPDHIPIEFGYSDACWHHYPKEALWELMESHPILFPDFKRPDKDWMPKYPLVAIKDKPYTDPMGCTWVTNDDGITGTVKGHPLESWDAFGTTWNIPDPDKCDGLFFLDWEKQKKEWADIKAKGGSFIGGLRHGHTFLQLCDLRGYENLLIDMIEEEPLLDKLIEQLEAFNLAVVHHFVDNGCVYMGYAEDLGMQVGPMISPDLFKKYIKPTYKRLMKPAIDAGITVCMHSDGDIRVLADDLFESGVQVLNMQDIPNGIDWIAEKYKGKYCIELDIDRSNITPFGTPEQIDAHIRNAVEKLATPDGGLMLSYGMYPGVPLENAKAVMDALEKYAFYFE